LFSAGADGSSQVCSLSYEIKYFSIAAFVAAQDALQLGQALLGATLLQGF